MSLLRRDTGIGTCQCDDCRSSLYVSHETADPFTLRQFSAVSICPNCSYMAVHWLDEPRRPKPKPKPKPKPEPSPRDEKNRKIKTYWLETRSFANIGWYDDFEKSAPRLSIVKDESEWVVARICRQCEYRWGEI